jgi:hypothetical protein
LHSIFSVYMQHWWQKKWNAKSNIHVQLHINGSGVNCVYSHLECNALTSFRDIGFLDFIHHPGIKKQTKEKTRRFGNWICFHSQVREKTYSVGSLRKS